MKKKLINKLPTVRKKQAKTDERSTRITNETVAAHREQILAGGRKFKYPVQYAKHKLVINSVVIAAVAIVVLCVLCWYLLYHAQLNTKFMYRLTQLFPVPVASVDGEQARYSDYLRRYRTEVFYLQQHGQINLNSVDGERQSKYFKRKSLDSAIESAYVKGLARKHNIKVSSAEVNDFITQAVSSESVSLQAYEKTVLRNYYDWSLDEYRGVLAERLLAQKVSFAVDRSAEQRANALLKQVRVPDADFAAIAAQSSDDPVTKASGGDAGSLPLDNQDPDGLIAAARKLNVGETSGLLKGSDAYYIIKLLEKSDVAVHYAQIKIELTELNKRLEAIKKSDKIKEYIKVEQL